MTVHVFPASFAQQRLWFFTQLVPDVAVYNIAFQLPQDPGLDPLRFERALAAVVERHETLRTSLAVRDGTLVQLVHPEPAPRLRHTDLTGHPDPAGEADRLFAADAAEPFQLDSAPLWRARLTRLGDDGWLFGFVVHHAVFDARSARNFLVELTELYRAGDAAQLPELAIQYADFAVWQRDQVAGGALDEQLDYWRRRLADLPPELGLPTDRPRPPRPSHRGRDVEFELPAEVNQAVAALSRASGTTAYAVLLAAFVALLHRLSGRTDVVVGSPVAGRSLPELQPLLGMFVNSLVLRTDCAGNPTFRELIGRAGDTVLGALENADVPFDRLVEELAPDRDAARPPLYQVVLNFIPQTGSAQVGNGTAKVDLILDLFDTIDGTLGGRLEYATDLFDDATAAAMASRYQLLLRAALADPDTPLDRLPLLLDGERERLTGCPRPATYVPPLERFDRQVRQRPDAVAVRDSAGAELTYRELAARAAGLAGQLIGLPLEPPAERERPVALLLDTDARLAVAVLGVLGAGRPYLPLDAEHPAERIRFLLADAGAGAIVTTARRRDRAAAYGLPVVCVDDPATGGAEPVSGGAELGTGSGAPAAVSGELPVSWPVVLPDALAYVVYTSGSTGRPKGVGVTNANLAAYLDGLAGLLDPAPGATWTLLQPLTFDFGVTTFFGALLTGGTLYAVDRQRATDAGWVAEHVRRDAVDYLKITPSHLEALRAAVPDPDAVLPARTLVLGGEASRRELVAELRRHCQVVNHYGPTETTVGVLALPADSSPEPLGGTTPIGWPLAHAAAYVLDERGEPVPDGVTGELCIGGDTVTRGYLGRPGLTADRFRPDPYAGRPGARLYRTGDRVRRLPDGAIEFLGRADDQVKIRGFRVELGEVRHVLAEHPDVRHAAVVATGEAGDVRLAGYLVPRPGVRPDLAAVRAHAAASLPEHMVPTWFAVLDELPLTAHGKLDRSRLPDPTQPAESAQPDQSSGDGDLAPDAPVGEFEEVVAALFGRLLGRAHIGRTDSFFALGGHSLLGIQLMTRLRAAFGVPLPLRAMFEDPTVAGIAARVTDRLRGTRGAGGELPAIKPAPRDRPLPASYGQQRLWFLDQLEPDVPLYNTHFALRLTGELDPAVLRAALVAIVRRHEVLRTRFAAAADGLTQVVHAVGDPAELPFDEASLPAGATPAERWELLTAHAGLRFDLTTDPPLRALLVRYGPAEHELLLTMHHTVFDGSSVAVFVAELAELYPALRDGRDPELPELAVQYGDFAAWQRAVVTGELADTQLGYWRERLAGLPPRLELPTDRPRPKRAGVDGQHLLFSVPDEVAARLRAIGADEGATLFIALLAGYVLLLRRYTGESDLAVGVPLVSRQRPELEQLVGFFVNTLVLRVDAGGDPTFRELVGRARATTIGAYTNADVPFEALVDELAPDRDQGATPLVQTMFMLADDRRAQSVDLGGLTVDFEPFALGHAKFDVSVFLWRRADGLTGAVEYRPDLFDDATVRRFVDHYTRLLEAVATDPDVPLSRLAAGGRGPEPRTVSGVPAYRQATAVELVAEQVRRTPDAVAVRDGDTAVGYRELWDRAGQIAAALGSTAGGGVAGAVVGVCLPRSADLVAALLGVLRAGAAYLPLDPDHPPARLAGTIADAAAPVVLTAAGTDQLVPAEVPRLRIDLLADRLPFGAGQPAVSPATPGSTVDGDRAAYVLYTSGSTGRPKGVVVGHAALANQLRWVAAEFGLGPADRVAQRTPVGFDASVWELFAPLVSGASVVVAPAAASTDPAALVELVDGHRVTVLQLVPSLLAAHLDAGVFARCPSLRVVGCGGEALPQELADRFAGQSAARLVNLYGPTECCVQALFATARPGAGRPTVPIGTPVPGVTAYVLDEAGAPVPPGVPGELYLGGAQVAHGYHRRPALTAERFVPDPAAPGARLYRTGDRVRELPGGELEYLGRLDEQVKVRGVRIELGEVRSALAELPGVRQAAAVLRELPTGPAIVGYVTGPATGGAGTAGVDGVAGGAGTAGGATTAGDVGAALRERLRERLPAAAVPAAVVVLDELPLLTNGKLDRAALPAPDRHAGAAAYTPPGTELERTLCGLYERLLGRDRVGVHDDFFAIGGHSLLVIRLVSWVAHELGVDIPLRRCFDAPTVAELALVVLEEQLGGQDLDQLLLELSQEDIHE